VIYIVFNLDMKERDSMSVILFKRQEWSAENTIVNGRIICRESRDTNHKSFKVGLREKTERE